MPKKERLRKFWGKNEHREKDNVKTKAEIGTPKNVGQPPEIGRGKEGFSTQSLIREWTSTSTFISDFGPPELWEK